MNISIDASDYNSISAANDKSSVASINIASNKKSTEVSKAAFEGVVVSGAVDTKSIDQNTYNSLMNETEDVKSQIMQSATTAKSSLKALFNRLNGADAVQINEDGFNLNDLSDEDCVNIVDRIKIELAAYSDNYSVYAGSIDVDKIQQVVGSASFANEIAGQMAQSGVPATQDNIMAVNDAVSKIPDEGSVSMDAKLYMVSNGADITMDNLQIAEHAYKHKSSQLNQSEWEQLKPQIESIITKAGLEPDEANMANAQALLSEDLPVTPENLVYMASLDSMDLSPENVAKETIKAMADTDVYKDVAKALSVLDKTNEATIEIALEDAGEGDVVNLQSLDEAYDKYISSQKNQNSDNKSSADSGSQKRHEEYTRMIREIQILMTAEAGVSLVRDGLDINTASIATLHEHLLDYDREAFMDELGEQLAHDIDGDVAYNTSFDIRKALYDIETSPLETAGAIYKELMYTKSKQVTLETAGRAYEAMESSIRGDLGDSINKAVEASAGSMLADMGMEDNRQNRQAVWILAKNDMDVTKENVMNIKELKSTLDSLVKNMKPDTVLDMIKNDVNPYTSDIRDVNRYLKEINENKENTEDKYSTFLYKLDRTDGISAQEREQYIGIFKMMNMFTNDAGKAIGALVKQGLDITMENLCTAYNSRRSYNKMDVSIDDTQDMQITSYENYYMNLFSATGNVITPLTLKNVNAQQPINARSVENFCEAADELYDAEAEAAYMEEYMELVRQVAAADSSVINELERGGENITLNNIQAMEQLMMSDLFNNRLGVSRTQAQSVFDSLDDREKLTDEISKLCDEASDNLAAQIDKDDNSYEVVKASTINEMTARMMLRGARRQDYTIPYVKEDGIGMMKVSFKSDGEDTGKIAISYEDAALGKVNVDISVSADSVTMMAGYATKASIFGTPDEQERAAAGAFKDKLTEVSDRVVSLYGFARGSVAVNSVRNVQRTIYSDEGSDVSTARLYKIAKTVVEGLV